MNSLSPARPVSAAVAPEPRLGPTESRTMQAIVQDGYGPPDVLELRTVDRPSVGDDDVLIHIDAAAVSKGDWHNLTGKPYLVRLVTGFRRPKFPILGQNVAGRVEAVGANVTRFQPGDAVFGQTKTWRGGFAEYVCVTEDEIARKPDGVSFEHAAAVPDSGMTALQALRKGELRAGQRVLINGASGGVGTFAVQIARSMGAHVTAVCGTANVEMVRSLGADEVIDYTCEDFAQSGEQFDLMLDVVGNRSLADCRRVLTSKGMYVGVAGPAGDWIAPLVHLSKVLIASAVGSQRFVPFLMQAAQADLVVLAGLVESGEITPVIGRRYSLREVPAALRHVGEGHATGKSIVTI